MLSSFAQLSAIAAVKLQVNSIPSSPSQNEASTQCAPGMGENLPANAQVEMLATVSVESADEQNLSSPSHVQLVYTVAAIIDSLHDHKRLPILQMAANGAQIAPLF